MAVRMRDIRVWAGLLAALMGCLGGAGAVSANDASREIAERLAGAMRFETISYEHASDFRGEPFDAHEAYLRENYPRTHAALHLEKVNGYTLLFKWPGSDPTLKPGLFMSHTDVVPVEAVAAAEWSHPPYAGIIEDGFVWGRGALDVKIGVILWLEAVEQLLGEGVVPRRTIYLSFGHDEEIGGKQGAVGVAALFRERGIELAFLFDEGGMIIDDFPLLPGRTVANVVTAEKAYYTVTLTARGVSGHSSIPPKSTAIGRLARAITKVEENSMPARLSLPVREMLAAASPYLPMSQRFAINNLWLMGGAVKRSFLKVDLNAALIRTTFAVTIVSGGVKENVIPERAQAIVNVRILPGDTPRDVLEHLERVIDDQGIEIEGEDWGEAAPPASVEGPAFRLASEAVSEVLPDVVVLPGLVPGATDTRHFVGVADEILRFVPMRLGIEQVSGAHGRDERIAVEPLAQSREIAVGMIRRAASGE